MTQEFSFPTQDFILLGKVVKAHGMRGEFKMVSFSGQPENLSAYKELILVDRKGTMSPALSVISTRNKGKMAIVHLESISDRTRAEYLEGMGVLLARKELPALKEDEFYWHEVIGKKVNDLTGVFVGTVGNIFSNGKQDILVIHDGENEILVPITRETIVAETGEAVTIDPPPGLLELYRNSAGNGYPPE
ncbi:ribosome maturation factor RimM [Desulfomarina profundi]|uniref:Ribosome maturation factor RimM n=1 Tax=Desulfomarina profundi TaxID=2772557 RepID=A0A8D5FRE0_9BACT|nr:ribosome maturation factor RimM [Desulfomarina profundi]BCL60369.1 ribosome maturation factor RimM [Desulfomarina profundi]